MADLIANHKPENVQKYPEKPKYNAAQAKKAQLSAGDSFEYNSARGGKIRDDFSVKYLNCNSPCLSQRSSATTATNTTNTSGKIFIKFKV